MSDSNEKYAKLYEEALEKKLIEKDLVRQTRTMKNM